MRLSTNIIPKPTTAPLTTTTIGHHFTTIEIAITPITVTTTVILAMTVAILGLQAWCLVGKVRKLVQAPWFTTKVSIPIQTSSRGVDVIGSQTGILFVFCIREQANFLPTGGGW